MITRLALVLALASCGMPPEILPTTTGESSTGPGEVSTGEDWGHSTTGDRDTTGSTGSPTSETTDSGVPSTSDYTSTSSTGESSSTGEPPGTCPGSVDDCLATGVWCVDLALFCVKVGLLEQSPNFCEGLNIVCATSDVAPCEICAGLVEQCTLHGAAMPCEDIAAECACLAA